MRKIGALTLVLIFSTICSAMAVDDSVKLEWSPNSEADLAGYKLHYGESSGEYSKTIDVGNVTSFSMPYSKFEDERTYYFVATAYDLSGNESDYSEEVSKRISASPDPPKGFTISKQDEEQSKEAQECVTTSRLKS